MPKLAHVSCRRCSSPVRAPPPRHRPTPPRCATHSGPATRRPTLERSSGGRCAPTAAGARPPPRSSTTWPGSTPSRGRQDEALPLLRSAAAIRLDALGPNHPDTAATLAGMAWALADQDRLGEALGAVERAAAGRRVRVLAEGYGGPGDLPPPAPDLAAARHVAIGWRLAGQRPGGGIPCSTRPSAPPSRRRRTTSAPRWRGWRPASRSARASSPAWSATGWPWSSGGVRSTASWPGSRLARTPSGNWPSSSACGMNSRTSRRGSGRSTTPWGRASRATGS
jgi:hypothetical protein